ncbi:DUF1214 domain-containing protein [Microbacterium azadirachtae]|uniref:Carboxylesterase n=1 Tax=Microbacterium azadirachtae TaxID=582680 RepID=A0A1I6G8D9_9MICO|nr:DUF1214 domain-containing protein [Microbacterium azadirachtae]SDL37352.1 Protein of unknown function [Microbacterium azadirachtae]SEF68219.1 Protein of unknown function [Microbacterium azadirachtae]SEF68910.1 Protein of unknown function [Microbacterium azadirachtae]SFR38410.1 Protein of unknown function [Microbacterium azadirachtae]
MAAIPVNVQNFNHAETDLMFSRLAAPHGVGTWNHTYEVTPLDDQPVIRQNRDTLYSMTIVDVREDVILTLPDTGDRYISAFVISQEHYGQAILSEPGDHVLSRDLVGTDYAGVIVRILVDPTDADDVTEVNRLQDALRLHGGGSGTYPMPDYDESSHTATRHAILELARGVSKYDHAFGTRKEVDAILHLLGTASGWGGLPEYEATYISVDENLPVDEYRLRLKDIPVDAFWSVSLYNAAGYFEENALGVNSINSLTATPDADGAVTIRFGTQLDGVPNALAIMPGWNYVLRLYRPHPVVLDGSWTAPRPEVI